ncbi:MAG: LacI family transcriptional regulator [Lachnospiraceae bacterium]|nr:LacI family transcriptional regulator [Lachnospiraceae bacterium]
MTIKDLARETGYSVGTVSRVLNNHPNVSENARKAIMEAVDRHDFILNTSAKNLKQQQSETIIAIVKGNSNELFASMLETIQSLFAGTKYTLVTEFMDEDDNEVLHARQLCRDKKPKGVLFLGGNNKNFREDFDKIKVPCVLATNDASELKFENLSSVTTNDCMAACCAVNYLMENGHTQIALIGGSDISDTSRLRHKGWEEAYRQRGIDLSESGPYISGRYSFKSGYEAMDQLLSRGIKVTAVFAMADVMAIGAISAIYDYGLRVPEDISVIGFDGIQIGEFYCPKITTIEQNAAQLAKRSYEMLVECIEQNMPARHEYVPFRLKCRQSVRKI